MNEILAKAIAESSNPEQYEYKINQLTETDRQKVINWIEKLQQVGAVDAVFLAITALEDESVLTQFDFSRAVKEVFEDVVGNVEEACEMHPDTQQIFDELCQAVGQEKVIRFLKQYGDGLGYIVANTLDEGNWCLCGTNVSTRDWAIIEVDENHEPTGESLDLHSNWYDFNEKYWE